MNNASVDKAAAQIKLLLMDVDGVMTDGRLWNVPDGQDGWVETKGFDSQDGIALQWCEWYGIRTGVISGRVSPATEIRARQCKMAYIYQGHIEKIPILEEILADSGISPAETAWIGDDLTDVAIMRRVALSFAPSNSRAEVLRAATVRLKAQGGQAAVREAIEVILKAKGVWPDLLKKYEAE